MKGTSGYYSKKQEQNVTGSGCGLGTLHCRADPLKGEQVERDGDGESPGNRTADTVAGREPRVLWWSCGTEGTKVAGGGVGGLAGLGDGDAALLLLTRATSSRPH